MKSLSNPAIGCDMLLTSDEIGKKKWEELRGKTVTILTKIIATSEMETPFIAEVISTGGNSSYFEHVESKDSWIMKVFRGEIAVTMLRIECFSYVSYFFPNHPYTLEDGMEFQSNYPENKNTNLYDNSQSSWSPVVHTVGCTSLHSMIYRKKISGSVNLNTEIPDKKDTTLTIVKFDPIPIIHPNHIKRGEKIWECIA